jgi:hypothetical protein
MVNSAEALQHLETECLPHGIEIDLQFDNRDNLVAFHPFLSDKLCSKGPVERSSSFKDPCTILKLANKLKIEIIILDLKINALKCADQVIALVNKRLFNGRIIVKAWDGKSLDGLMRIRQHANVEITLSRPSLKPTELVNKIDVYSYGLTACLPDLGMIGKLTDAKHAGFDSIIAWTIDKEQSVAEVAKAGATMVITNYPCFYMRIYQKQVKMLLK